MRGMSAENAESGAGDMKNNDAIRGRLMNLSVSPAGKQSLTIELDGDFRRQYDALKNRDVSVNICAYRKRRSLDANAYAWKLIDKLAAAMGVTKTEIYRSAIREIGGVSDTICVFSDAADKLCEVWAQNGLGWQTERLPSKRPGCVNVILYYGSSVYDTRQMSALINQLTQDCLAVGIEPRPPEEVKSLLEEWEKHSQ